MQNNGARDLVQAAGEPLRLIRGVGGNYWVHDASLHTYQVQAPGIFRKKEHKPLPGDLVICEQTGDELIPLRMTQILERKNELPRPQLANLDCLWLLIPLTEPEPDLWMLDKMLVIAFMQNIPVKIIFTKHDLLAESEAEPEPYKVYKKIGYDVLLSSLEDDSVLQLLNKDLQGHLIALAGPSGAGKSTLLNRMLGEEVMETAAISEKLGRGRHTTRHAELFPYKDGYLVDTPGFSSLDLFAAGADEETLVRAYPEIWALQNECRFLSCKHLKEPGCAVKNNPDIDAGRLERYREFRRRLEQSKDYERKNYR